MHARKQAAAVSQQAQEEPQLMHHQLYSYLMYPSPQTGRVGKQLCVIVCAHTYLAHNNNNYYYAFQLMMS